MEHRILIKEFLVDGPEQASHVFVFAHGAGVGMASPFMDAVARSVGEAGIRVVRFHFPYMEASVRSGRRRIPDGGRVLRAAYAAVVRHCVEREHCPREKLVIGGKSMGGRIASMIADEQGVAGVVCMGYPFHPPRQRDRLRVDHLRVMRTPTLICQGERDPFGTRDEVEAIPLAPAVRLHWVADGDHGFVPRKRSGASAEDNLREAAAAAAGFIRTL